MPKILSGYFIFMYILEHVVSLMYNFGVIPFFVLKILQVTIFLALAVPIVYFGFKFIIRDFREDTMKLDDDCNFY